MNDTDIANLLPDQERSSATYEENICNDCYTEFFYHLTEDAVRTYLRQLVDYLDDFDNCCPPEIDEDWRSMLGMTHSGI